MAKIDKRGRMIAIADYLFDNPDKDRADALSKFGKAWSLSNRTIDRVIQEAKAYNLERIREQERIKDEVMAEQTKTFAKDAIMTRHEAEEILTKIARGMMRKIDDEVIIPSDGDRIKATQQLAKMRGWEPATKIETDQTITIEYFGLDDSE